MQVKVFNGEQAGAVSNLSVPASITLGNHYQCDIFVADHEVAEYTHHLQLSEDELVFTSLAEQAIYLPRGEPLLAKQPYSLPVYLLLGQIQVGIGEQLGEWIQVEEIEEEEFSVDLNETKATAHGTEADSLLASMEIPNDDFLHELDEQLASQAAPPPAAAKPSKLRPARQIWLVLKRRLYSGSSYCVQRLRRLAQQYGMKFYIASASLLVLGMIGIATTSYVYQFQAKAQKQTELTNLQKGFKKKFAELPSKYNNLFVRNLTNKYQINGLILSAADESELNHYFAPYALIVNFQLITLAAAQNKIKAILAGHNLANLSVSYSNEELQLIVRGLVNGDLNQINDLEIDVNNQLPQLNNIQFAIYPQQQLMQDLNNAMGEISKFLNVKQDHEQQQIIISGYLTHNQLTKLESNLIPLRQKYQQIVNFQLVIKDTMSALPFHIFCVYYGQPSYIVTTSGAIVYEGGQIGEFKFSGISDNKIILTAPNFTLEIPLSQINTLSHATNSTVASEEVPQDRAAILKEENSKTQDAVRAEQHQLELIHKYKQQVNDQQLRQFLQEQEANLSQDIKLKKQDLDYYAKELNING